MVPVTHKEFFLAKLEGEDIEIPAPVTREEFYLAYLCGVEVDLPVPVTVDEMYLAAMCGMLDTLPAPVTRLQLIWAQLIQAGETNVIPVTREEQYWVNIRLATAKTVTGSLIHITDALASPVNALSVNIDPVQSGTGDPSPDNVRPISGWTGAKVNRTGKNLLRLVESEMSGMEGGGWNRRFPFSIKAGSYKISCQNQFGGSVDKMGVRLTWFDKDENVIKDVWTNYSFGYGTMSGTLVFTESQAERTAFIEFRPRANGLTYQKIADAQIMLEAGETATAYEPYTGSVIPVSFGDAGTVYGGTLDVLSGVLTVDKVLLTFSGGATSEGIYGDDNAELYRLEIPNYNTTKIVRAQSTTSVGRLSSNYFKFISTSSAAKMKDAEIRTQAANTPQYLYFRWDSATDVSAINAAFANTALQVIGELQSPQTYQLTPQEVSTLLGENNIWADTGDTTVTYLANA